MHTWLSAATAAEPAGFLLDNIADAVVAIDAEWNIRYWNQAAAAIYGWQAAEVLMRPLAAVLSVVRYLDGSDPAEVLAQTYAQGVWRGETVQRHRDGHELIIEVATHLLHDAAGAVIGMVAVNRDVTARHALERERAAALAEAEHSRALLESLIRAAPVGFAFLDPELRYLLINERLAADNGFRVDEHLGRTVGELMPALGQTLEPLVREVLASGQPAVDMELNGDLLGPPWQGRHWQNTFYPVARPDGQPLGVGVICVEVSELKRLGLDLAHSRAQLAGIIDSAMDAIITVDAQQRIVLFNQAAERLFGVAAADALGTTLDRFIPAELRTAHREHIAAFGRSGAPSGHRAEPQRPLLALRADGSSFPIETSISQLDVDGSQLFTVILRDISERRDAEQQLRASEANLRAVFDNTAQSFVLLDPEHRVVLWNRLANERTLAVTGKPLVAGTPVLEYTSPALLSGLLRSLDRAARGEPVHVEYSLGSADRPLWLAFDYIPVRDASGAIIGTCMTTLDITAQRVALEAVTRSEERFRALVAEASDLIVLLDGDLTLRYASPAWERVLGRSIADWIGRNPFSLIHPDDLPLAQEALAALLGGSGAPAQATVRLQHGRGGWVWAEAIGTDMRAHPAVGGLVLTFRDTTERRRLTEQLLHAQKIESVGRLAGGVAHDFNNLLTAMSGYNELALDSLPPDAPARAELLEVQKAVGRASELTRQLLAFARKQTIAPQPCALNSLIADMERLLRRLIGEDIALVTRLDPEVGVIMADPGQIEQVIVNLAINARDAMPHGGTLTICTAGVFFDAAAARRLPELRPGRYVQIAVSDTGVGIDEQVREHIFEPFFTTKGPARGTGLGLATCYGIIAQHGGTIEAVSRPGAGATFLAFLPEVKAGAPRPAPPQPPPPPGGSETVLVVEDDESVRGLAARVLREHGYTVLEAADGQEALRLVAGEPALRLVLSDVVMPQVGGRELVARLRADRPQLPVVCMSGYTDDASTAELFRELGVRLIDKPFTRSALLQTVRELLGAPAALPARPE